MAIMQEIETKLQKGISVSSNEEVYFALLDLVKEKKQRERFQTKERRNFTTFQQSSLSESFYQTTSST